MDDWPIGQMRLGSGDAYQFFLRFDRRNRATRFSIMRRDRRGGLREVFWCRPNQLADLRGIIEEARRLVAETDGGE